MVFNDVRYHEVSLTFDIMYSDDAEISWLKGGTHIIYVSLSLNIYVCISLSIYIYTCILYMYICTHDYNTHT